MICKQKKLVKVLLLTVVVSLFTMTTAFAQEYPTQNNNARYIGISMLNADLSIDDNGKSSCSGNVVSVGSSRPRFVGSNEPLFVGKPEANR